jgi:hypothetical protein
MTFLAGRRFEAAIPTVGRELGASIDPSRTGLPGLSGEQLEKLDMAVAVDR